MGKVEFCDLYPMTFSEFLLACGEDQLYEVLVQNDHGMMQIFKNKYIDYLKYYFYIGGMPGVVLDFTTKKDFKSVRTVQNELLAAYENDLSKHAPKEIVTRIRMHHAGDSF